MLWHARPPSKERLFGANRKRRLCGVVAWRASACGFAEFVWLAYAPEARGSAAILYWLTPSHGPEGVDTEPQLPILRARPVHTEEVYMGLKPWKQEGSLSNLRIARDAVERRGADHHALDARLDEVRGLE